MKRLFAGLKRRLLRLIDVAPRGRTIDAHRPKRGEVVRSILGLLNSIERQLQESRQHDAAMFEQLQAAPGRFIELVHPRLKAIDLTLQESRQHGAATLDHIQAVGAQVEALIASTASHAHIQAVGAQVEALIASVASHAAESVARLSLLEYNLRDRLPTNNKHGGAAAVGASQRRLYLDLLETSLTGELIADGAISPWSKGAYEPQLRFIGRDWPATALTMIGTARMRNLRHLLERVIVEDVPGDFIETGVWRGGACIYARGIIAAYGDTRRRVWVADSFCGLPPPTPELYPADAGDRHHTVSVLAVSADDVRASFARYGLLDGQVVFLEGWFKDTLPTAPIERISVLRLDGDMYESTTDALVALYDKVSTGGFVIIDDYLLPACAKAVHDFLDSRDIMAHLEPVDGAAVFWQKES